MRKFKLLLYSGCLFFVMGRVNGQTNYFDVGAINVLISENKSNYSDHQSVRNKQLISEVSVSTWKKSTNEMKRLVSLIDKRMNSIFIITADAGTTFRMYQSFKSVLSYQQQAIATARKYPWLVFWAAQVESIIINDAIDISRFLYLMIVTYGDINKMTVASRKLIYTELDHQLSKIVLDAQFLVAKLKMVDFAETFKNTSIWRSINNDKNITKDILKEFKF